MRMAGGDVGNTDVGQLMWNTSSCALCMSSIPDAAFKRDLDLFDSLFHLPLGCHLVVKAASFPPHPQSRSHPRPGETRREGHGTEKQPKNKEITYSMLTSKHIMSFFHLFFPCFLSRPWALDSNKHLLSVLPCPPSGNCAPSASRSLCNQFQHSVTEWVKKAKGAKMQDGLEIEGWCFPDLNIYLQERISK